MNSKEAIARLTECGVKPSVQRIAIMHYLLTHYTHPTTVYNTLRLLSENNAAQMITIDEHRVCYDGNVNAHAHFYCKQCRKVYDIFDEVSPLLSCKTVGGHSVDDVQLYYKGVCSECMKEKNEN